MKTESNIEGSLRSFKVDALNEAESEAIWGGFKIFEHDTSNFPLWGTKGLISTGLASVLVLGCIYFKLKGRFLQQVGYRDSVDSMPGRGTIMRERLDGIAMVDVADGVKMPNNHPLDEGYLLLADVKPDVKNGRLYYSYSKGESRILLYKEDFDRYTQGEIEKSAISVS